MANSRALLLPLFLYFAGASLPGKDCPGCKADLEDSVSLMQLSKMSVNRKQQEPEEPKVSGTSKVLKLAAESITNSVTKQDPKASVEEVLRLAAGQVKGEDQQLPAAAPCVTTPGPIVIPGLPPWVDPATANVGVSPCGPAAAVTPFPVVMTPQPIAVPCAMTTGMPTPCAPTTEPCPTPPMPDCFSGGMPGDMKGFKLEATRESTMYGGRDFYHYTVYIGDRVEQRRIGHPDFFMLLGKHDSYDGLTEQFTNGDTNFCPDGTARSSTVHYQQGAPGSGNAMLWDGETAECHYEMYVQIDPLLCHPGLKKVNVIVGYNVLPPEPTPCFTPMPTYSPCDVEAPPGPPLGNLTIIVPPPVHVPAMSAGPPPPANVPGYTLVPITTPGPAAGPCAQTQQPA